MKTNPFFDRSWSSERGVPPFHLIEFSHYQPAFDEGIRAAKENLEKIAAASGPATFQNTVEAIEFYKEDLERVGSIFFNMNLAHTSDEIQALAKEISPKLAELSNDLLLNDRIFARVKAVWESKPKLSPEEHRLLEQTWKAFKRNGALLDAHGKEKLREIDRKMARLTHEFSENVLKDTNAFQLLVTDPNDVKGLPANAVEDAAHTAEKKGHKGAWLFTLQFPSYQPFMQYCENSSLREKMWRAYMSRGTSAQANNRPVLQEIASLRHQRAQLLGYKTHAHFVLEERMAQTPDTVEKFLREFISAAKPAGQRDFDDLRALKRELYPNDGELQPWDTMLLSEKLRQKKYDLSDEELRPYLPIDNVIRGVFTVASKLYGLEFRPREDVPLYHPDVQVFDVYDAKREFLGLFYCDFFPRESKKSGAWMTTFREQGVVYGKNVRPWVSIVCNFTKPTASQPSLLTMDEVNTLFHEFGHALHGLLSRCHYASLGGANVYWDFVELPSQFMENFTNEKECLDLFAGHFKTGEKMPEELIRKLKASRTFQAGLMGVRQTAFGLLDMAWHSHDPSGIENQEAFEVQAIREASFFPHIPGTSVSPGFSHIFAGGYSAGYYSYKWAEVLDADAFEFFRDEGLFNRTVADRFRENVLERGGTEPPMDLYKRFRGREPDPKALLRRDGLI